jgi:hypothetical protein
MTDLVNEKPPARLVSRKYLADMMGINYFTVMKFEKAGRLTPIKLTPLCVRYSMTEVEALIESAKGKQ